MSEKAETERSRADTTRLGSEPALSLPLSTVEALALNQVLEGSQSELPVRVRERLQGLLFR